jgi:hypothetical protein
MTLIHRLCGRIKWYSESSFLSRFQKTTITTATIATLKLLLLCLLLLLLLHKQIHKNGVNLCLAINTNDAKFSSLMVFSFYQENGPIPNRLQKVDLAIVSQQHCNDLYNDFGYRIYDGHICADVPQGNRGSCNATTASWAVLQCRKCFSCSKCTQTEFGSSVLL